VRGYRDRGLTEATRTDDTPPWVAGWISTKRGSPIADPVSHAPGSARAAFLEAERDEAGHVIAHPDDLAALIRRTVVVAAAP
jgi:hypothetical protein